MKRSFRAGGMSSGQRRSPRLSINHLKKRQASIDLGEKDNSPILDNMRRVPGAEPNTNVPVSQDVDDRVTPLKRLIENERAVMKKISERHGASHEKIECAGLTQHLNKKQNQMRGSERRPKQKRLVKTVCSKDAKKIRVLEYLYVSAVKNEGTTYAHLTFPIFKAWSDLLLRERQAHEAKTNSFGKGVIIDISGTIEEAEDVPSQAKTRQENEDEIIEDSVDYEYGVTTEIQETAQGGQDLGEHEKAELGLMHDNNRDSTMGVLNEEEIEATVMDKSMYTMTYENNKEGQEQSTQKRSALDVRMNKKVDKKGEDKGKTTKADRAELDNARPKRGKFPSAICRSPYVSRIVDISGYNITVEARNIWDWLFSNKRDKGDYLFQWKGRGCTKAHMRSLGENMMVETTVIDSWTCILNENEILRADTSPLRLFLTTETTYGPMQMEVGENDSNAKLNRQMAFDDNMEVVWQMVNEIHNKQYDITDFELHECFCHFLECYNIPKYSQLVRLQPEVVSMEWQSMDNNIDCDVFVMRHLETYMGNIFKWKSGLRRERENQKLLLNKLRVIYCHQLLSWVENEKRKNVVESVATYMRGKLMQK
ncbi:hypothetical protein DCAR_0519912 [Daucus carota subsp. sativus]|uniref:Ubiquitin-like protease family profile domain-containing protein n=1 Tax=Daucus carota subsp. sativus TaxID=79200 RepID=A0AAF1B1Y2_DAUCS|nr:hypothetical protein DCAR_0519912 [Daucus carota subsp. sativus]